jgi:hypothetical protein
MKIPDKTQALQLLEDARQMNPGPWVTHSLYVAKAAEAIAGRHPSLNEEAAFVFGCLHDIGRRFGISDMRHILDGYQYLMSLGYDDAAQICLTHSFPILRVESAAGKWDCSKEELQFIENKLKQVTITDYDRLIQLCDALALPTGFTLIEKRFVDVTMRHGFNDYTIHRWKAYLDLKTYFEKMVDTSIYRVLPNVVESTFGFDPCK